MRLLVRCRFAPFSETPRLAVRHGLEVVEPDGSWFESFGPDCWLAGGQNATAQVGHDSAVVGQVVVVVARDAWWYADLVVESDEPNVLERVKVGAPVSLGARTIKRDDDIELRLRRHTLAQLEHIAIVRRGEHPGYQGAQIVGVTESRLAAGVAKASGPKPITSTGWLDGLPDHWKDYVITLQPGDITELTEPDRVYRWDGRRWNMTARTRGAA